MIISAKYFLLVFAILTLVGGIMGYVSAKSMASLVAGVAFGAILFTSFVLLPGKPAIGLAVGFVASLALAIRFVPALLQGGGFMPAGLMSVLSVIGLVLTAIAFFKR